MEKGEDPRVETLGRALLEGESRIGSDGLLRVGPGEAPIEHHLAIPALFWALERVIGDDDAS